MSFVLDTNAVIALLGGHVRMRSRLSKCDPADVAISAIVAHELYFGAYKSQRLDHNLGLVDALNFRILDFDRADARRAGEIRAGLKHAGAPIGPYDVLIAGQALARGYTLVSRNVREFRRVRGLAVEDWEGPGR